MMASNSHHKWLERQSCSTMMMESLQQNNKSHRASLEHMSRLLGEAFAVDMYRKNSVKNFKAKELAEENLVIFLHRHIIIKNLLVEIA